MSKPTDIRMIGIRLYFLPVHTRIPYKFGTETLTDVVCARVEATVQSCDGIVATGWGETPLSVGWVWPSELSHSTRLERICYFTQELVSEWVRVRRIRPSDRDRLPFQKQMHWRKRGNQRKQPTTKCLGSRR